MVRLYVGGLAADVTAPALAERFSAFGTVRGCELPDREAAHGSSRGFGFVDLDETNEASLRRCISLYNGCKWRGLTMRVEIAKPSMLTRLEQERLDQVRSDAEAAATAAEHSQRMYESDAALPASDADIPPLNVLNPMGKAVAAVPSQKRKMFPPYAPQPKDQVDWQAHEAPAKQTSAAAPSQSTAGRKSGTGRKLALPLGIHAAAPANQPAESKQHQQRVAKSAVHPATRPVSQSDRAPDAGLTPPVHQPSPASSSEQPGVVNFMTEGDDANAANAAMHAYDSSDADESLAQPKKRQKSEAPTELEPGQNTDIQRHSQRSSRSDDTEMQRGSSVLSSLASPRLTEMQEAAVLAEFARAAMEDGDSDSSISDEDEAGWEQEGADSEELGRQQHLHACQCIDCVA